MDVLARIIANYRAVDAACGDYGNLAGEVYESLQHCGGAFQGGKGIFCLRDICDPDLPFAIIPETASFEDGGCADSFQCCCQIRQAVDLRVGGDGDAEVCKEGFFGDAVL